MKTYNALDGFIGSRNEKHVPRIRATVARRYSEGIAVVYHGTAVVRAHQDGTFTLSSGGFRTSTTKARMNDFSPASVCQRKGVWWVYWFQTELGEQHERQQVKFYDGIRVDASGVPVEVQ